MAQVNLSLDVTALLTALRATPQAVEKGSFEAFKRIKRDWVASAVDTAPIKDGELRKQIVGTSDTEGVMLTSNAMHGGFNYAYYQHEVKGNNYLERSLDENKAKLTLERQIKRAMRAEWGG